MIEMLIDSTWETLFMVGISGLIGCLLGVPLGVLLFVTDKLGMYENILWNKSVGFIVNAIRSTPYIILVVALIPLTRLLVGTSIGTAAATVPLSLAAVMLYCRIVEDSLRTVPMGLIEAAESMGASRKQIITKVLIPEALPSMLAGFTLILISLVGFSAMSGAVGGGGLGDLGIRYGYQRYNITVIIQVVVILIALVQLVQSLGDYLVRRMRK